MTTEFSPKTHTVLAVVLGILGILIGFLLTFVGGVVAGALALILGVDALLIGVKDYKATKKGMGSIIVGVLAILVAIVMTVTSTAIFSALQEKAVEENQSKLAECLDKPYLGMIGLFMNVGSQSEASLQEMMDQLNALQNK